MFSHKGANNMNPTPRKIALGNRLFTAAVKDMCGDGRKLPEPNHGVDSNRCNPWPAENPRNNLSDARSRSYNEARHTENVDKMNHRKQIPYKYGQSSRHRNASKPNSYSGPFRRNSSPRNKSQHNDLNHFSSQKYVRQNSTPVYGAHCSSLDNDLHASNNECSSSCKEKKTYNISNDLVLGNSASQIVQFTGTDECSSLRDRTAPFDLPVGNNQTAEFISNSNCDLHKEVPVFLGSFNSHESHSEVSINSSLYPSETLVNFASPFANCESKNTSEEFFIPPPTPCKVTSNESQSRTVIVDSDTLFHKQNENTSIDLLVSDVGDLSRESGITSKCSATDSASNPNVLEPVISSAQAQTCHINPESSNLPITFPVENCNTDELEELSSCPDSVNAVDLVPEQIEAVNNLLCDTVKTTEATYYENWEEVVETLTRIVKKCIRGFWLAPYGSYVSHFAIWKSDFNVALIPGKHTNSSHKILQEMVKVIQKEIPDGDAVCDTCKDYKNAVLTYFDPKSNVICRIKILKDRKQCWTAKLLHRLGELDSRVKTLIICIRHWAEKCEIHGEENGTLHPLCYVLMMIHFLQQCDPPLLPVPDRKHPERMVALQENKHEVGYLWVEFFKYYSESFNWKDNVVSIMSKDVVLKASKDWKCWIAVEEPYDESVNVAKSVVSQDVSNFIQLCFSNTYRYFFHPTSSEDLDADSDQRYDDNSNEVYIDSNEDIPPKYDYDFYPHNFLNGLCVPVVCLECEQLGHLCDECLHCENVMLYSLPKMTPEFLRIIDEAVEYTYERYRPVQSHMKSREDLMERLQKHLKKHMKNARVELIGSSRSGFGLKDSDLDICFTLEGKSAEEVNAKIMVKKIKNILLKHQHFTDVVFISSSKIPIVKFIDRRTKLRCDISIYNELAAYNTSLLHAYSKIDKRVSILGCAMKVLAKNACINDTALRTLSSYSYVLMVLYFLQQVEPPVIPVLQELYDKNGPMPSHIVENTNVWFYEDIENLGSVWDGKGKNCQSVGELWMDLLEFYTTKFDYHHFISISQKSVLTELKDVSSSMLFNIQDAFIKDLNLGRKMSSDMSRRTLKAFQRARILFGTPIPTDKPPSGFLTFQDYFFNPMKLTDGRVMGKIECSLCGKFGHNADACRRHKVNTKRPWKT